MELHLDKVSLVTVNKLELLQIQSADAGAKSDDEVPESPIIIKNTSSVDQTILQPWIYATSKAEQGMRI